MNVWEIIGLVVTVMGVSVMTIVVTLWNKVFRKRWYRRKYRNLKPANAYILLISRKSDCENAKSKIRTQWNDNLINLKGLPIETVSIPDICDVTTVPQMMDDIMARRQALSQENRVQVHLFYAGPVALPAFIGGFFYNKDEAYIYQKNNKTDRYECWGKLHFQDPLPAISYGN